MSDYTLEVMSMLKWKKNMRNGYWKQNFDTKVLVATTLQLAEISMGGACMYPSVLLQQLRSTDSIIKTDLDTLTWIASMHGITGVGATLMPTIMQLKGRKFTFICSCLLLLIGWIIAFGAMDAFTVVISSSFLGLSSNCIAIVNIVTVSEMLAPKYRAVSLMLLSINQTLGRLIVMVLGTVINWKTIALVMCGPVIVALIIVSIWPESPSWLAYKGKFEESERSFIWLRGSDTEATKELQALIAAQKQSQRKLISKTKWQQMYEQIKSKDFYFPSLYMFLVLFNLYICGGAPLHMYSKDIIETAIGDSKIAVIGYVSSSFTSLIGSFIALVLIRYFKTKTVLSTALGCIVTLLCCSSVPWLQSLGLVHKNSLLFLYFFLGYIMFCSSGFIPVTYSLSIELMPVKHRGFGGALYIIMTCLLYVITVKSFPYIILYINISWTFILFAACSMICTVLIWIYVPETKNRTLQEIEDYYNHGSFVNRRGLEDIEVNKPIVTNETYE